MGEVIRKTVIITGYACNNRCRFCMEYNKRSVFRERTTAEIKREMQLAKRRGSNYIELIGGEFTIRPDAVTLLSYAKDLGFETIMIATNGRLFSYPDRARKFIESGLNSLVFSIHGHTAELHDFLTQAKGSYDQLRAGVANAMQLSKELGIEMQFGANTTVVKPNYKFLPEIGEYIRSLGIGNTEFIFVDSNEGGAYDNFDELVPTFSESAPYINKCLEIGDRDSLGHWHIRYVPLCIFIEHLDRISEIHEGTTFKTEHLAPDFIDYDIEIGRKTSGRVKPKRCSECVLNYLCEGIWPEYVKRYGDQELRPVTSLTDDQLNKINAYTD